MKRRKLPKIQRVASELVAYYETKPMLRHEVHLERGQYTVSTSSHGFIDPRSIQFYLRKDDAVEEITKRALRDKEFADGAAIAENIGQ